MSEPIIWMKSVLAEESAAIASVAERLGAEFEEALRWIHGCEGRVITCGIGKSGHIARKTAGTLSSTGTPSLFLHAAEAMHGDLGMATDKDVILAYSQSGETDEVVNLFLPLKSIGCRTILITGRPESSAGRAADLVLNTHVLSEACPNNLAPTTSTTVMLALSDAMAVAVMKMRNFTREDFAKFHPSGALGKRLLLTVRDVMRHDSDHVNVLEGEDILEILRKITKAGAGAACVVSDSGVMIGIISDGDIRRHLIQSERPLESKAHEIMSGRFSSISPELLAIEALEVFQNHPKKIGEMPVLNSEGHPIGTLTLKDLLRSGIV